MNLTSNLKETIKVISFDLDNTLYDNQPVITLAEKKSRQFLQSEFNKQGMAFVIEEFMKHRNCLLALNKAKYDNLTLLREDVLKKFCKNLDRSELIAQQALDIFINARQKVIIEPEIFKMLEKLSQSYQLVTITNGNCNAENLSCASLFDGHYSPNKGYRAKPQPCMLNQTLKDFSIKKSELLHVGDEFNTDGKAAENCGCSFHYFKPFAVQNNLNDTVQELVQKL